MFIFKGIRGLARLNIQHLKFKIQNLPAPKPPLLQLYKLPSKVQTNQKPA